jgi:hypothetical protein
MTAASEGEMLPSRRPVLCGLPLFRFGKVATDSLPQISAAKTCYLNAEIQDFQGLNTVFAPFTPSVRFHDTHGG